MTSLPDSSLAWVCRSLADFIGREIQADQNKIRVMVGSPSEAAPKDGDFEHRLNLLFYRFEETPISRNRPAVPGNPSPTRHALEQISVHCLVTAFGLPENGVSAGENDLRLLGEVLRVCHEQPVFEVTRSEGERVRIQTALRDLTVEQMHDLWSIQGTVSYRPSLALVARSDFQG